MNIIDALRSRELFGTLFPDLSTWGRWLVFLKSVYGLALTADEVDVFRAHTGRSKYDPPSGGYPEAVCIVGRQSGKTRVAGILGGFEGLRAHRLPGHPMPHVALIAQDFRAALRSLFSYAAEPFEAVPELARAVVNRKSDSLELENGVAISCYPCRPAAVRGLSGSPCVIVDELAFFRSSEGYPTDTEMLRAVRPLLATSGGKLIVLSSPYAASGALHDLHRKNFGQDGSSVLIWQSSAPAMNPTLSPGYLQRMAQDDPEAYRSEVLGEFRKGLSTLLDPDALDAVVASGVRERAPIPGGRYTGFADVASGSGADSFTVGIARLDGDRAVLDCLRAWSPPFDPSGVIAEAAALLKRYGLFEVVGDNYAPGFVREGFSSNGITYQPSERNRSEIYLELLPSVNAGSVVLLDDTEMLRELRGLERRRGPSGRDRVDHRGGAHDDRANAAAGALTLALDLATHSGIGSFDFTDGSIISGWDSDGNEWQQGKPFNGTFPPRERQQGPSDFPLGAVRKRRICGQHRRALARDGKPVIKEAPWRSRISFVSSRKGRTAATGQPFSTSLTSSRSGAPPSTRTTTSPPPVRQQKPPSSCARRWTTSTNGEHPC